MIALIEQAAATSLLPYLKEGQGSVGIHLDVSHEAATPIGINVDRFMAKVEQKKA